MRARERRKGELKKRKNALPALIIIILGWFCLFYLIYFVDPASFLALVIFFFLTFVVLLFTISTIFTNSRIGLIWSGLIVIFLLMRFWGIGTILNLILIFCIGVVIELYFWEK